MITVIRHLLSAGAVCWGLVLLSLSADAAFAAKRVALVIGNGAYQNAAKLHNPARDAKLIADMFTKAKFDKVIVRHDVGNLEFKRALREFYDAAHDAETAVVYYAGHGIQIRDMNYMVPIDARLANELDAEDEAVTLDRIVSALEPAKKLRLVILDACRDNPFAHTMRRRTASRNAQSGLAKTEISLGDTLIAYAAKAGSTADDGDGTNSPFATALVKHLAEPGLDVRLAFGRVRDEVLKLTANKQEPFVYGSLGGTNISIVPAPEAPKVAPMADVKGDYELVERIGTRKAWEVFLSTHQKGLYADLARAQLAKIIAAEGGSPAATPAPQAPTVALASREPVAPPQPAGPSTDEQRAWDRVKDSSDLNALRGFIKRYPVSVLALNAQHRLEILERAAQEREEAIRKVREAARQKAEEEQRARAEEAARQRAEREAAQRRADDEQRAKAEEAARQRAEREAAQRRAEEERRAKASEAERQRLDREAAARREREEKRAAAEQAAREKAEREAAAKREAEEKRRAEAAAKREAEEKRRAEAEEKRLKAEEEKRLKAEAEAERRRQEIAALGKPSTPAPGEPPANTPELIRAAQKELERIGCYAGRQDGVLSKTTADAVERYHSQRSKPETDGKITEAFVSELMQQPRVCPLACPKGQVAQGETCVAEKPAAAKQAARPQDEGSKPAPKAKKERPEPKRQQASRPQPAPAAKPQTAARPAAAAPRVGGMIGVGF